MLTFTPHGLGLLVDDLLQPGVELVPLGQQMVQVGLAQDAPQVVWAICEVAAM